MVHEIRIALGDQVRIEVYQTTSVEEIHEASILVNTPGLIELETERHSPDLVVVSTVV